MSSKKKDKTPKPMELQGQEWTDVPKDARRRIPKRFDEFSSSASSDVSGSEDSEDNASLSSDSSAPTTRNIVLDTGKLAAVEPEQDLREEGSMSTSDSSSEDAHVKFEDDAVSRGGRSVTQSRYNDNASVASSVRSTTRSLTRSTRSSRDDARSVVSARSSTKSSMSTVSRQSLDDSQKRRQEQLREQQLDALGLTDDEKKDLKDKAVRVAQEYYDTKVLDKCSTIMINRGKVRETYRHGRRVDETKKLARRDLVKKNLDLERQIADCDKELMELRTVVGYLDKRFQDLEKEQTGA